MIHTVSPLVLMVLYSLVPRLSPARVYLLMTFAGAKVINKYTRAGESLGTRLGFIYVCDCWNARVQIF